MDISLIHGLAVMMRSMPVEPLLKSSDSLTVDTKSRPYSLELYDKEYFVRACLREYPFYSENEADNLYFHIKQFAEKEEYGNLGIFSMIIFLAEQALRMEGNDIRCRHEEIINWRETVHGIGQPIFNCAYMAWQDVKNQREQQTRIDFPICVKTDNMRLRNMLSQGMAENHFHLKGSSPVFLLSWVCLMNHVTNRKQEFESVQMKRSFFSMEQEDKYLSLYDLTLNAAAIRLYLTRLLTDESFGMEQNKTYCLKVKRKKIVIKKITTKKIFVKKNNVVKAEENEAISLKKLIFYSGTLIGDVSFLQRLIDTQRFLIPKSLDYVIDTSKLSNTYSAISGENVFLYRTFSAILTKNPKMMQNVDLFYAYLLIFVKIRGELIQSNRAVGFHNFSLYEQRKEVFTEKYKKYTDELIRMAQCSALDEPSVRSLEARIVPKKSVGEINKAVDNTLKLARSRSLEQCKSCSNFDGLIQRCGDKYCINTSERLAYVFHLVKEADKGIKNKMYENYRHRHYKYIHNVVNPTVNAIIKWRKSGNRTTEFVYGIDGCNAEIGCRPEVFAPGFRKIRASKVPEISSHLMKTNIPIMRITYHVGEDFLDIADGLRAIDETIYFMELYHGDRLGHAIALGINVKDWYRFKGGRVLLARQDLLDNAMWMYMKLHKLGICDHELAHELTEIFRENFNYVYRSSLPYTERDHDITLNNYYDSWQLRGDHPKYYRNITEQQAFSESICFADAGELRNGFALEQTRNENWQARYLMHHYHYNPQVKKRGAEIADYCISSRYIGAVEDLQNAMQKEIAHIGIAIETNPSSNYLISTFKKYEKHPLVVFNDQGLCTPEERPQMFVSINTDDQGVFDTNLENEYALMANALENCKDENGKYLYKPADVYRWLDNIRRMGLEQSFKNVQI